MREQQVSPRQSGQPAQHGRHEHSPTEMAAAEEFLELVSTLKENLTTLLPMLASMLNIFQKTPVLGSNKIENPFDMLDLASEFLAIPSSYLSDQLGGCPEASISDRLRGFGDLEEICEAARPENKLVLVLPPPSADDYFDFKKPLDDTDALKKIRVLRGHFKASSSSAKTEGDDSGFAVSKALGMRRDQLWFMMDNASAVVAREQAQEYQQVNYHARKPYEYAFKRLITGVLSLTPETAHFQRKLDEMDQFMLETARLAEAPPNRELPLAYPSTHLYRCPNLPVFTVLMINELISMFSGIQKEYLKALRTICTSLNVLNQDILPKTGRILGVRNRINIPELGEFLDQVKQYCEASSLDHIKQLLNQEEAGKNSDAFVLYFSPGIFVAQIDEALKQTEPLKRKIRIIITMCPTDASGSEPHRFLINFKNALELFLAQMRPIRQHMGDVDELERCNDAKSFLGIYAELRNRYRTCANIKRPNKPLGGPHPVSPEPKRPAAENLGLQSSDEHSLPEVVQVPRPPTPNMGRRTVSIDEPNGRKQQLTGALPSPKSRGILTIDAQVPISGVAAVSPRRSKEISQTGSPRDSTISGTNSSVANPRSPSLSRAAQSSGPLPRPEQSPKARINPRHSPNGSPRSKGVEGDGVDFTSMAKPGTASKPGEPMLRGKPVNKGDESMRRKSFTRSMQGKVMGVFEQPLDPGEDFFESPRRDESSRRDESPRGDGSPGCHNGGDGNDE